MHAQNTLLQLGADRLNEQVLFRDLEGVVFSDRYRRRQGLPALLPNLVNEELLWTGDSMRRWYNRKLDDDIGRTLQCILEVFSLIGYFDEEMFSLADRSIRRETRATVAKAGLSGLHLYADGCHLCAVPTATAPVSATTTAAAIASR